MRTVAGVMLTMEMVDGTRLLAWLAHVAAAARCRGSGGGVHNSGSTVARGQLRRLMPGSGGCMVNGSGTSTTYRC